MKRILLFIFMLDFLILNCLSTIWLVKDIDCIQKIDFLLVNLIEIKHKYFKFVMFLILGLFCGVNFKL